MVEPLRSKREAIAATCARHSVVRLEAFGSALRDDYVPGQGDVDLLVEACAAIESAIADFSRVAPPVAAQITQARRSVDFRNQLTHEYPTVDDAIVWLIAEHDVPILRRECTTLLATGGAEG
jgi:predicted nucleotidyltransferase